MHAYEVYQLAGGSPGSSSSSPSARARQPDECAGLCLPWAWGGHTPSACPACETRLTWQNIPVFGWLFLRGRCRFCKAASARYPLVEASSACCSPVTFYLWYWRRWTRRSSVFTSGISVPEWALSGFDAGYVRRGRSSIVLAVLLPLLVAMTLVDFKTCTIPLPLPGPRPSPATVFHTGCAIYFSHRTPTCPVRSGLAVGDRDAQGKPNIAHAWWWIGASFRRNGGAGYRCGLLEKGPSGAVSPTSRMGGTELADLRKAG